jgi:hypothetical protein
VLGVARRHPRLELLVAAGAERSAIMRDIMKRDLGVDVDVYQPSGVTVDGR